MSVTMNSKGHNKTPHVKLNDKPDWPNNVRFAGDTPSTFSKENIFPPIHSAINALATKKAVMAMNNVVGLSLTILLIMFREVL
jgi:hypothetical protein